MVARISSQNNWVRDVEPVEQAAPSQPKVVLFGDSISSAVGYGQDTNPDTRYGQTVAEMLSKQWGVPVDSQAMGGVTTKDALTGSAIPFAGKELPIAYGSYEKYLKEQRPDVVLLRFGAADAIRLNDPAQTLSNVQAMVDMAKSYGATPVVIGVSPFAAGGDSRAGNINAGSIDPFIGSANAINQGLQAIAQQNQLPFVDMRSLEVPKGALLDGVHPTAEFGKEMAEHIGNTLSAAMPQFGGTAATQAPTKQTQAAPAATDGSAAGLLSVARSDAGQQAPQVQAGLLNVNASQPQVETTLAEQIRALYGNRGDWNSGGIDRATELADLLQKQGITDVSKIALQKGTRQEQQFSGGEDGQMSLVDLPANQVLFGDKRIGFAGDYNNDNTYGSNVSDYLQGDNTLGWSARGHGNVTYKVGTDAQGNNYLMPEWGSSSDMKDVRNDLKAAAVIAAMAYGLPMLGEAAGAAAGAGEAAAGTGLLSSAPLSTTLGAPLTELTAGGLLTDVGLPAVLSEAAIPAGLTGGTAASTLAGLTPAAADTVQQIVTTGKLGSAPSLLSTVGPGAAAATVAATTLASNPAGSLTDNITPDSVAKTEAGLPKQPGPLDGLKAWAAANPELAKLLFSGGGALLSAAGGPSSTPGGYVDSGYRPTISRGGFDPAPQARQMAAQPTGLLMPSELTGQANSGLWRYANTGNPASNMAMSAVTLPKTIGAATAGGSTGLLSSAPPAALLSVLNAPRTSGLSTLANLTPQALPSVGRAMTSTYTAPDIKPFVAQQPAAAAASKVATPGASANTGPAIDYSTSKYFDPNNPFAAGAALNQQYKELFAQDGGATLPDMRPYGGRYAGELASQGGRRGLGRDLNLRDLNTGETGLYRPGDFDMLPGMAFDDEWTQKNYASMFQNGNSMFVPDKVEVDPGYWYRSAIGEGMSKQDQEKNWSESYYGGRLLNSDPTGADPEVTLRNLMNSQQRLSSQQTPESQQLLGRIYAESRAPLIGMDVGRGGLSYEQGDALNRVLEYRGYLDKLGPAGEWNQKARDTYQGMLDQYMPIVNTISNPDGLSSAELLKRLQGGLLGG